MFFLFLYGIRTVGGEKLGRDRTSITKEVKNYSVEQDSGHSL